VATFSPRPDVGNVEDLAFPAIGAATRPGPVPAARREFGENSGDGLSIRRRPFVV
jgi:hypothetical protein